MDMSGPYLTTDEGIVAQAIAAWRAHTFPDVRAHQMGEGELRAFYDAECARAIVRALQDAGRPPLPRT